MLCYLEVSDFELNGMTWLEHLGCRRIIGWQNYIRKGTCGLQLTTMEISLQVFGLHQCEAFHSPWEIC